MWQRRPGNAMVAIINNYMKQHFALKLLFFLCCALSNKAQGKLTAKVFDFGSYKVEIDSCANNSGSIIVIKQNGKKIYEYCRHDGVYVDVDTVELNRDSIVDFVFTYAYDDHTTLGIILSSNNRVKYSQIDVTDDLYAKEDCNYKFDEKMIKDFIITDLDKDAKADIVTIALGSRGGEIVTTECSRIFLNKELLKIIKQR